MKKIILLFFFPTVFFSQEINFVQRINSLDSIQIKVVADEIMSGFRNQPQFYIESNTKLNGHKQLIYYDRSLSQKEIENDWKSYGIGCQLCKMVEFNFYFENSNKDLEIKGRKKFYLAYFSGPYLDLFPWWSKHFAPEITKEDLIEKEHAKRYIEDRSKNINIRFVKNLDEWEIRNIH